MKNCGGQINILCFVVMVLFLTSCGVAGSFEDSVSSGDYEKAVTIYREKISGNSSKELDAKNFLLDYMQGALSDYALGKIDSRSAESKFNFLLEIDNALGVLNVNLGHTLEQFTVVQGSKDSFQQAVSEMKDGHYEEAAVLFANVYEDDAENYEEAQTQIENCTKEICDDANQRINQCVDDENYEEALTIFKDFSVLHPEMVTENMKGSAELCQEKYREQIVAQSIKRYHNEGAEAADAVINQGLQLMDDDQRLINVSNLYQSVSELVSFKSLTGSEEWCSTFGNDKTDSLGKVHSSKNLIYFFNMCKEHPTSTIERNVYGTYSTISGDLFFLDTDYDMSASMKIFLDGTVAFDSGLMDKKSGGTHFNVDISNVYSVKIELSYIDVGNAYAHCLLDNVFVSRELTDEEIYQAVNPET